MSVGLQNFQPVLIGVVLSALALKNIGWRRSSLVFFSPAAENYNAASPSQPHYGNDTLPQKKVGVVDFANA